MSFDWSEYLKVARELAGQPTAPPTEEAKLRSAISRAYYAAFIKARNFLQDKDGATIPFQNSHQYVINQFRISTVGIRQKIGNRLLRLRIARNQADYNNIVPRLAEDTLEALTLARRVIAALENLE